MPEDASAAREPAAFGRPELDRVSLRALNWTELEAVFVDRRRGRGDESVDVDDGVGLGGEGGVSWRLVTG